MVKIISTDDLLKLPAEQRLLQLTVNKYREILNDIKEPSYTPDMFEYWWSKTATSNDEKEAVRAALEKDKLYVVPANKIVTWDNIEDYAKNVLNQKVFSTAIETIKADQSLFAEENHKKIMTAVITFEGQRTSLGKKNLLLGIKMSFEGEYGGDRSLVPEITHIRAFDGWPAEIVNEVAEAKKNK